MRQNTIRIEGMPSPMTPYETKALYQNWDDGSYAELARRNMLLAVHRADHFFQNSHGIEWEDMLQTAFLGLVKAARGFDPGKGFSFSTYAVRVIDNQIKQLFRHNTIHPYPEESLNEPVCDHDRGETGEKADLLPDNANTEQAAILSYVFLHGELTDRERSVLFMYAVQGLTQREIAKKMGVTQGHISRILASAKEKLMAE